MTQVVDAKAPEPRTLNGRQEVVGVNKSVVQNLARRRREDQLVGNVGSPVEVGIEHTRVSQFQEHSPQLSGEVNAPCLLALGRGEFSVNPVSANPDEPIAIGLARPELDVSPTQSDYFSPTHPGTQDGKKQRVAVRVQFFHGGEESLGFFPGQSHSLKFIPVGWQEPCHLVRRVHLNETVFYRAVQDHAKDNESILKRVGRQTLFGQRRKELLDVVKVIWILSSLPVIRPASCIAST